MDMKFILDIMGITGGLSSFVFWISSNHIYKDVITQIKEIRNETISCNETLTKYL